MPCQSCDSLKVLICVTKKYCIVTELLVEKKSLISSENYVSTDLEQVCLGVVHGFFSPRNRGRSELAQLWGGMWAELIKLQLTLFIKRHYFIMFNGFLLVISCLKFRNWRREIKRHSFLVFIR